MKAATVALLLSASAIQHCAAGGQRALRAFADPSTHDVLLHDESHSETHQHKYAAKISLMTIASERGPATAHHAGPHYSATNVKKRSHIQEAHLSEVKQSEAHSAHTKRRRESHADSKDAAGSAEASANVVVRVDAKDVAIKAVDQSHIAATSDSSSASGTGAVAYDSDATYGSEAAAIYHTIAEAHADDTTEAEEVADVDSAESEDETKAASGSRNFVISDIATDSENTANSDDFAVSEGGADSEDVTSSEVVVAEAAADSKAVAKSVGDTTDEDDADAEDVADSDEMTGDSEVALTDSETTSDSEGADVEALEDSTISSKSQGSADTQAGSDSDFSAAPIGASDTEVTKRGSSATEADASTEKGIAANSEVQPDANSTVPDAGLPGQLPGQDGQVIPEPTASDEGDGARTEPGSDAGSLNIGSSVMQADAVGQSDSYHDGSTESEDWGKEYGAAAQAFHDQLAGGERQGARAPHQRTTAADGGGGSGTMALVVGLVVIFGLLAVALGLGAKL